MIKITFTRKNKPDFKKKAIILIAVLTIIFTIAQYVSFMLTGVEQTVLIERWFTVVFGELGLLMLKALFDKKKKTNEEAEEEDNAVH